MSESSKMTMVERVARAIAPKAFMRWQELYDSCISDDEDEGYAKLWADSFYLQRLEDARDAARAALQAMREPTEVMVVRGDESVVEMLSDHSFALKEQTPASRSWQAMIDAALAERQ